MGMIIGGVLGGAAAPAGPSISLRDVGAFYRTDVDGFGNDVDLPVRVAGDMLFCVVAGSLNSDASQAGWLKQVGYTNNRLQCFTRTATGDANDAFTIPADVSGARIAQMASFQHSGFVNVPPDFLQDVQAGGLVDGFPSGDTSWDYFSMSDANLYSNTLVLWWALKFRGSIADATLTLTPPYPASTDNEIASFSDWLNEGGGTRLWFTWGYEFQPTDEAMAGGNITYTPLEGFGVEVSQYTRWEFNP